MQRKTHKYKKKNRKNNYRKSVNNKGGSRLTTIRELSKKKENRNFLNNFFEQKIHKINSEKIPFQNIIRSQRQNTGIQNQSQNEIIMKKSPNVYEEVVSEELDSNIENSYEIPIIKEKIRNEIDNVDKEMEELNIDCEQKKKELERKKDELVMKKTKSDKVIKEIEILNREIEKEQDKINVLNEKNKKKINEMIPKNNKLNEFLEFRNELNQKYQHLLFLYTDEYQKDLKGKPPRLEKIHPGKLTILKTQIIELDNKIKEVEDVIITIKQNIKENQNLIKNIKNNIQKILSKKKEFIINNLFLDGENIDKYKTLQQFLNRPKIQNTTRRIKSNSLIRSSSQRQKSNSSITISPDAKTI